MAVTMFEDDDPWKPTPSERRFTAVLLDGAEVEYKDLKVGDIFRCKFEGRFIHPIDLHDADDVYGICIEPPIMGYGRPEGFGVPINTGSLETLKARAN